MKLMSTEMTEFIESQGWKVYEDSNNIKIELSNVDIEASFKIILSFKPSDMDQEVYIVGTMMAQANDLHFLRNQIIKTGSDVPLMELQDEFVSLTVHVVEWLAEQNEKEES